MNVAYILHIRSLNNGAAKALLNVLDGLRHYGVTPFVVLPGKGEMYKELTKKQIPTFVVNYRFSAYPEFDTLKKKLLFIPRLVARIIVGRIATKALTVWLKENKIDIVHSNTGVVRVGFDAAQKVGIPHIYHIREFADKIGIYYFPTKTAFVKQLDSKLSYTICITKAVQQYYHQDSRKDVSRVIYDGVFSEIPVMPTAETRDYFLFAGRINPAKGLDQLLTAYKTYAQSVDKPLVLKVAGNSNDNVYYNKMVKFVVEQHLGAFVEFLGNRNDVADLMRAARALIISSPFEGFGFCMPEAMQQGCLVIARNTSGTKEQLDTALELTGQEIALRYDSADDLALLLTEVATRSNKYYQGYRAKAFEVVNRLYTQENSSKEVYKFYEEILHRVEPTK